MAGMFVPFMWSDSIEKAEKIVKNRGGGQLSTTRRKKSPEGEARRPASGCVLAEPAGPAGRGTYVKIKSLGGVNMVK